MSNFRDELNRELSGEDFKDALKSLKDLDDKEKALVIMVAGGVAVAAAGVSAITSGIKKAVKKHKDSDKEEKTEKKSWFKKNKDESPEKVSGEVVDDADKESPQDDDPDDQNKSAEN